MFKILKRTDDVVNLLTIADTDLIINSVHIEDGDFPLDGNVDFPRNITIDVTTATITAGTVTVTGIDFLTGLPASEVLDLSLATTLVGTIVFSEITSVVVADLADEDPADVFIVGVGSVIQVTKGRTTLKNVIITDDGGDVGKFQIIDGISGTTTNVAEFKKDIAANDYKLWVSISAGLRVVMSGDTPLTITYSQ